MAKAVVNLYPTIELDEGGTADLAEMFRLLGDGTRLAIVIACLDKPCARAAIAAPTGASPSLARPPRRLLRRSIPPRAPRSA